MVNPWSYIYRTIDDTYSCIICGCAKMGSIPAIDHVNGQRHLDAIEEYADDIVLQGNNTYYCSLCECSVCGYNNVYKHLMGQTHQDFLNESDSEQSNDEKPRSYIVTEDDGSYCCLVCDYMTTSWLSAELHCKGSEHQEAMEQYGGDISFLGSKNYRCTLCDCRISGNVNVYDHLMGHRHQTKLEQSDSEDSDESCSVDPETNPWYFIAKITDSRYSCFICGEDISGNVLVNDHVNGNSHLRAIEENGRYISNGEGSNDYDCDLCECTMPSYKNVYDHLMGQRHSENLKDLQ